MKKKLLIFTLLLCVFLTVSAVSASDIQEDDANSVVSSSDDINLQEDVSATENVNEESNENAAVAASNSQPQTSAMVNEENKLQSEPVEVEVNNYTELSDLFESGGAGKVNEYLIINLAGDEEYNVTHRININPFSTDKTLKNLVINGNNRIMNGFNESAFLFFEDSVDNPRPVNITINNLIIKNCYDKNAHEAGPIFIRSSGSNLTVDGVLFEDNHAGYYCDGGAIKFEGTDLTVFNSNFTRNYAFDQAGAIKAQSNGGFVYVENCIFTGNRADFDGTDDEDGDGSGGGIYISTANAIIKNCQFYENRGVYGGGVYIDDDSVVAIIGSKFADNTAEDSGPAVLFEDGNVFDLINCDVIRTDIVYYGGSVYHNFTIDIPDSAMGSVPIDVIETRGFKGEIKIAIGEEIFDVPFADGHGSTTVIPTLPSGVYNVTLIYKAEGDADERRITFKQIAYQNVEIGYNVLNNITGNVAIEITLYNDQGEEIDVTTPIILKLDEVQIGAVKPFRVFKNTEFAPGTYTIIASFEGVTKEINLVVIEDPATVINELNTTLNETKEVLIETTANLTVANAKIAELNTTLNQTQEVLIETTANLTVANAKIDQLEIAIAELQKTTSQLQASLKQAQAQITSLQNQLNKVANLKSVASAATLKRTAKSYVITATITKKIKGKKVSIVFNGKLYTATTNANGVAKLTIGKAVIKNLKKGKLVYNAIYGDKTIKKTITIK